MVVVTVVVSEAEVLLFMVEVGKVLVVIVMVGNMVEIKLLFLMEVPIDMRVLLVVLILI